MKNKLVFVTVFIIVAMIQIRRSIPLTSVFDTKGICLEVLSNRDFFKDNSGKKLPIVDKDFLVVTDRKIEEVEGRILENIEDVFKYSKIGYDIICDQDIKEDVSKYRGVIIIKAEYYLMEKSFFENIKSYVSNGGTLYFLNGVVQNNPFRTLSGITNSPKIEKGMSIIFNNEIFPGFENLRPTKAYHYSDYLDVELENSVSVIGTNENKKPLFWEKNHGKGRVIYANTPLFMQSYMQGFMKQLISYGTDFFISPILNSKVFHIDDLPLPIPEGTNSRVFKDYGVDNNKFFKEIWWEDMKSIAKRNGILYTSFMIISYGIEVTNKELEEKKLIKLGDLNELGRYMINEGWEIGVHGYNHAPLGLADEINFRNYNYYKPWSEVKAMDLAHTKFLEILDLLFGKNFKVFSYVPPSNLLGKTGKISLVDSYPYLKSIGGLFDVKVDEKGLAAQKVGVDPDYPQIYDLPRFSYGYLDKPNTMWNIYNGIAAYGYVSHFNHPDDIISDDRNYNSTWDDFKKGFERIILNINRNAPELRAKTQIELAIEFYKIENIRINKTISKDKNNITFAIDNFNGDFFLEMRVRGKKIKEIKNGDFTLKKGYPNNNLYLIHVKDKDVDIVLGDD